MHHTRDLTNLNKAVKMTKKEEIDYINDFSDNRTKFSNSKSN